MRAAILLCACLAASCSGSGASELVVDLETDMRPASEFSSVHVTLYFERERVTTERLPVTRSDDFLAGARVAEMRSGHRGDHRVVVALRDLDDRTVAERTVRVRLEGAHRVTVVITRDCVGVECPRPGDDPAATACLAGECVPPECTDSSCVDDPCTADGDCAAASPCSEGVCRDGLCLQRAYDDRCPAGMYCAPGEGCLSSSGPVDAGMDAGEVDSGTDSGTDSGGTDSGGTDSGPCPGECSPGETDNDGCGNCGTRQRTCGDDCTWGSWSGCSGEGECSPGDSAGCSGGFDCSGCESGCCTTTCCRECTDSCTYDWVCDMACVEKPDNCTDYYGDPVCNGGSGICQECPTTPGCFNLCTCDGGSWTVVPGCIC